MLEAKGYQRIFLTQSHTKHGDKTYKHGKSSSIFGVNFDEASVDKTDDKNFKSELLVELAIQLVSIEKKLDTKQDFKDQKPNQQ